MGLYTFVLKNSGGYWVALCLENGIASQGKTREEAVSKVREAIESFEEARQDDPEIYTAPVPIKELHEFLSFSDHEPVIDSFELRAIYA